MSSSESAVVATNQGVLLKSIILFLLSVLLASSSAAVGKHISGHVSTSAIIFFQYSVCWLLSLPWVIRHGLSSLKTELPGQHLLRGISGCLCFYAFYLAITQIPLVDAMLLRNAAPLLVPFVIFLWLGVKIPGSRWLPLGVGFLGVSLILRTSDQGISLWHVIGLLSGLSLAISMVSTRQLTKSEPEGRILFYYFLISTVIAVPFYCSTGASIPVSSLPWLLYIGVAMYLGFWLYTKAFGYVKASVLSPMNYFAVVFAALFDWGIWGRVPSLETTLGIVLVVVGGLSIWATRDPSS